MEKTQENGLMAESALCKSLKKQKTLIRQLENQYSREPGSVSLLAVSKTKPLSMILDARNCGHLKFGENYVQELEQKVRGSEKTNIEWHFIGPIQSNKTRSIATHAHWVHSLDRVKIARRLSAQRPDDLPPLQICIQVNIDRENSKSGILIEDLKNLCEEVSQLQNLKIRGLMCIPKVTTEIEQTHESFARLRQAKESLNSEGYQLDTLSMGMSGDFEAAIAEGATIIRIGTAIFGERT